MIHLISELFGMQSLRLQMLYVLILQHNHRVGVTDSRFQQALCVFGAVGSYDLQTRYTAVPRTVVLRMLRSNTCGEPIGSSKCDIAGLNASGHVVSFASRVYDLVNGLHCKVEGHEFALRTTSISLCD